MSELEEAMRHLNNRRAECRRLLRQLEQVSANFKKQTSTAVIATEKFLQIAQTLIEGYHSEEPGVTERLRTKSGDPLGAIGGVHTTTQDITGIISSIIEVAQEISAAKQNVIRLQNKQQEEARQAKIEEQRAKAADGMAVMEAAFRESGRRRTTSLTDMVQPYDRPSYNGNLHKENMEYYIQIGMTPDLEHDVFVREGYGAFIEDVANGRLNGITSVDKLRTYDYYKKLINLMDNEGWVFVIGPGNRNESLCGLYVMNYREIAESIRKQQIEEQQLDQAAISRWENERRKYYQR